jgi:hypothetical protein
MAGEAGMGGAPEPEWRPVGPSPLDDPEARSEPDLELAPDGTPYLAFKSCTDCDISSATIVPVVERFDGSRWRLLPTDGLPSEIVGTPALTLWEDGTPYVLVDGQVSRFDSARWVAAVGAPLPGPTTDESNFQVDQDGTVWVTLFDSARQEISVVRSLGDTWETIGLPVSGRRDGVHFVMDMGGVYLAHTDVDGDGVFVRTMMSGAWMGPELAGQSVDVAVAPDGTLYVAIWQRESALSGAVRVLSGAVDALADLGTIGSVSFQAPSLEVSTDGTLYAVFLATDFVNVNRFDGENFRDVKSLDIGNGTSPALRLSSTSSVPFVAFQSGLVLQVKKYE